MIDFKKFERDINKAFAKAIESYEDQIKDQILSVTPNRSGDLRASYSFQEDTTAPKTEVTYVLSFGDSSTIDPETGDNYAGLIHQWPEGIDQSNLSGNGPMSVNPNWTTPGTGPNYILGPITQTSRQLLQDISRSWKILERQYNSRSRRNGQSS